MWFQHLSVFLVCARHGTVEIDGNQARRALFNGQRALSYRLPHKTKHDVQLGLVRPHLKISGRFVLFVSPPPTVEVPGLVGFIFFIVFFSVKSQSFCRSVGDSAELFY